MMKRLSLMLFFILLFLQSTAHGKDKLTFQLDWLPGGDKAPIYVGIEQGFFATQNIDVKISHGKGSTDALTKLAMGRAHIGYADMSALLRAKVQSKINVTALMSVMNKAPHAFFFLASSKINNITDIQGKRVATSPFTSSNVFLPLLLDINHIPKDSIRLIKADPGALGPMLATGNTDIVISWLTDKVKYQSQVASLGKELQSLPWYDAGLEFYATTLIANDRFLSKQPDLAKRFVKAFKQAIEFTWQHPKKAAQAVNKHVPEVKEKIALETILSMRGLVFNAVTDTDGLGTISPSRLATTWQWVAKSQQIALDKLNPESVVNRQILHSVNAAK